MQVHCLISLILILFLSVSIAISQDFNSATDINKVSVENGNIYFSTDSNNVIQLTETSKDRSPILSSDEQTIVFIRKSNRKAYSLGYDILYTPEDIHADQLWIIGINDKKERMLVKDWNPDIDDPNGNLDVTTQLTKVISDIYDDSLQFSPNGKKVYFITYAWATSGAIHSVNIDGTNEHFIVAGNYLEVINRGILKGNLIVQQHRYRDSGGYDWFWLFSPEGKEMGVIGESLLSFHRLYMDSNFTSFLEPKRSNTNTDPLKSARDAIIEIISLSNSALDVHKAKWVDLDKDGKKDEFIASYTLDNSDFIVACDPTSEADKLLFYKRRENTEELEIRYLTCGDKPFVLVSTVAGSGCFIDYTLYEYDGIGKLQKVFSEEDLFQGRIYLGNNCLYRSARSQIFKLTYENGKFNFSEYKQRLEADPYAGTHVITYDWDEKEGFIISFDHEKVTFKKSDESSIFYLSNNVYTVRTDDVIYVDDNMVGGQPHGIKILASREEFHFIHGLFMTFKPAKPGKLGIQFNGSNGYLIRINAVEP